MTGTTNRYGIYEADHRTYGGELTSFDFEGHYTMAMIARKIMKDCSFDRQCEKNIKAIRQYKERK